LPASPALITWPRSTRSGLIRLYRLTRHGLELPASAAGQASRCDVVALPRRGEIAIRRGHQVIYLNAKTLADVTDQQDLADRARAPRRT
jgi:hypothetical protein